MTWINRKRKPVKWRVEIYHNVITQGQNRGRPAVPVQNAVRIIFVDPRK